MRHLFEITASMKVFDSSLNRKKNDEEHKTKALSDLLRKYEEKLDTYFAGVQFFKSSE